jgi:UDP-glucose 4-epimerase
MRVLVTGATGFVASHLIPALAEDGHEVLALGHDARRIPFAPGVTPIEADLREPLPDVARVDAVAHLAQANVPFPDGAEDLFAVNTASTHALLECARRSGAGAFVYASSGSVYGYGERAWREDDPARATDFYSTTKLAAELLVRSYAPYFATAVLRLFTPYGPGQQQRLVARLVEQVRNGAPVMLNGGGRPRMTPIFVADVVRVVQATLNRGGHDVVNVAGDEVVDIRELAVLIGELVGREPLFVDGSPTAAGDLVGDNAQMHALYGLGELVPLEDGLRATVRAEALT